MRELAQSYFKLRTAPNNVLRTSLDELDEVERHLNQELPLSTGLASESMSLSTRQTVKFYGISEQAEEHNDNQNL